MIRRRLPALAAVLGLTRGPRPAPTGRDVIAAVDAILDAQDAIERRSYDPKIGIMAVASARRVLEDLPVVASGERQLGLILAAFGRLRERQAASVGEFSTGASTIGSILAEIGRRFPG